MRKLSLSGSLFILLNLSLQAQNTVGIFAGPQITTAWYSIRHHLQPVNFKWGGQAGVTLKMPFEGRLYFSPAFYYSAKGYKVTLHDPSFPPDSFAKDNNTRFHTLDLGVLLQYDFGASPSHFFLKAGPSLEAAFYGHEEFTLTNGKTIKRKMAYSFGDYGIITASAVVHFGYETEKGLFIFAHYAHGLSSMNNADNGPLIKQRVAGLSVGKYFRHAP